MRSIAARITKLYVFSSVFDLRQFRQYIEIFKNPTWWPVAILNFQSINVAIQTVFVKKNILVNIENMGLAQISEQFMRRIIIL